jgi:hypothetical protein
MKTFKQYIIETDTWGPFLSPWLPYPNSGGKNVVTPGSIKPPKKPPPARFGKLDFWKHGGQIVIPDLSDWPDEQAPPDGVAREWPDDTPISE